MKGDILVIAGLPQVESATVIPDVARYRYRERNGIVRFNFRARERDSFKEVFRVRGNAAKQVV